MRRIALAGYLTGVAALGAAGGWFARQLTEVNVIAPQVRSALNVSPNSAANSKMSVILPSVATDPVRTSIDSQESRSTSGRIKLESANQGSTSEADDRRVGPGELNDKFLVTVKKASTAIEFEQSFSREMRALLIRQFPGDPESGHRAADLIGDRLRADEAPKALEDVREFLVLGVLDVVWGRTLESSVLSRLGRRDESIAILDDLLSGELSDYMRALIETQAARQSGDSERRRRLQDMSSRYINSTESAARELAQRAARELESEGYK